MEIQTKALKQELQWVNRFAKSKSTTPILQNVLFDADGASLTLTATDLEASGVTAVAARGQEKWSVAVPVRKLIQYLDKVDEDEIALSAKDNTLTVQHGALMRVIGMSRESYPELPVPTATQAVLGRLQLAVERVAFAISKEESRFTLDGALLEIDEDEGRLMATDGHRLSVAPVQTKSASKFSALIRRAALLEAGRSDGECALSTSDDFVFMSFGQRRIVVRKMTGNFPDYRRCLRDDHPSHVMLPVKSTLKVLERVAICADERSHAVRFDIEDSKLTIFASSIDNGEATGAVAVQMGEGAGPLEAGYNAEYIIDFLSRADAQFVAFCYQDAKSMITLATTDQWLYSVMPMRI